jgi:hypothetical protein
MKKPSYTSPECLHPDGTLIQFVNKNYLIKYLRYLKAKNYDRNQEQSI